MEKEIQRMCVGAREAARKLAYAKTSKKNLFLNILANLLKENQGEILRVNDLDVQKAKAAGMDAARIDRLRLTPAIIAQMAEACLQVVNLPDPVGATEEQWRRPNGILVGRMRIPLGVVAMIYEARPNVTVDAAILCLKAGNAVILRGGKEALESNKILAAFLKKALLEAGLPEGAVQFVNMPDHEAVDILCRMDQYIDVMIPRGGENLIRKVSGLATMPVLKHYKGVCHVFVDKSADLIQSCDIVVNAKTQRPGVCNALECLLAHEDIADRFLPMLSDVLAPYHVELRADGRSLPLLGEGAVPMSPEDAGREFHSLILAVKTVKNIDEALDWIAHYGSNHTEVILTKDYENALRFCREADASMVGVNVSTRFNDGGELGLGAEIGISTSKLHAYGPMGIKELTTTKFVVLGEGQTRA